MKMKYTSQTGQKPYWKNTILLAITALALCASPGSRGAELCNQQLFSSWTISGTGEWSVAQNWCGGVPLCHSFTCISNGGTAHIGTGTTANACETFLGRYECDPFSCQNSGTSGNLSVDGGTLDTCNELHVGYQGTGNLKIMNGGLVSTTANADIATGAGSYGAATVDGASSQWTATGGLYVGGTNGSPGGTGLLTLTNGGKVSVANVYVYQSGTLTGNGRVGTTNGTTVEGTIQPSGGTLTIDAGLTFSGSTALMETNVVPASADNVYVSGGAASLNGRIKVTMTGTFTPGTTYTLLTADVARNGTFPMESISFPSGQNFTPKITYDTHHVYLYLQPNT